MQWYYAIDDQRLGPVSHAEFEQLMQSGKITAATLVWRKGMDQWKTLGDVRERDPALFSEAPPPLPSPEESDEGTADAAGAPRMARESRLEAAEDKPNASETLDYAGFWRRCGAHLMDLAIWWVGWLVISQIVTLVFFPEVAKLSQTIAEKGIFSYQPTPHEATMMLKHSFVSIVLATIWAIIYDTFFILRFGATPGKLLFGLRIVKTSGKPLDFANIVGRCLAKGLLGLPTLCIGYLIVAFDDQKRSLHDHVTHTRVVKKQPERADF